MLPVCFFNLQLPRSFLEIFVIAAACGMSEVSARMFGENDVMWYDENVNLRYLYGLVKDKETFEFCMKAGLIANKYECCKCGKDMKLVERHDISDGFEWRCKSKVKGQMHDVKRSAKKGSFYKLSRMTLKEILVQVYLWVTPSKVDFNMKESKCSSKTVCDYRSYCREVCVVEMIESSMKVGGSGVTVEIDESKFGKRKFNREKHVEGKWVFGGVEREKGKCFMKAVDDRTTDSLLSNIFTTLFSLNLVHTKNRHSGDFWQDFGGLFERWRLTVRMSRNTRVHGWCFTQFGGTPEAVFDPRIHKYMCFGRETCPTTGRQHLQGYIYYLERQRFSVVKKSLANSHIEAAKGSPEQNKGYCSKDGDFTEYGELQKLRSGGSFRTQDLENACGVWICGPPRCGKDSSVLKLGNVYRKMLNKWWDGYRNEKFVLLSDVEPDHRNWLGYFLKIWSDRYAFNAEIKGGTMMIRPEKIFVTSNFLLEQVFDGKILEALRARFNVFNQFDDSFTSRMCSEPNLSVYEKLLQKEDGLATHAVSTLSQRPSTSHEKENICRRRSLRMYRRRQRKNNYRKVTVKNEITWTLDVQQTVPAKSSTSNAQRWGDLVPIRAMMLNSFKSYLTDYKYVKFNSFTFVPVVDVISYNVNIPASSTTKVSQMKFTSEFFKDQAMYFIWNTDTYLADKDNFDLQELQSDPHAKKCYFGSRNSPKFKYNVP
ncbi:Replication-associated protein like [Argiope bruennichi]|uniref:ATP-dependent helicase Rep n=1 Tax=Argiope bruennichi TaxID=94029 RepID=A0A8T0FH63_ARGBR|nr:Replication-associated protein like [Argiope bruennichi]